MPLSGLNLGSGQRNAGIDNYIFMPRTNHQKGLCNCGGWLQTDKLNHQVYCIECNWREDLDDYQDELDDARDDYQFRDYNDNFKDLNKL